jgi:hypothetical protein
MADNLITLTNEQYYEGKDGLQLTGDDRQYGNYQFYKIGDIINDVLATYCGTGKLLAGTRKSDVSYHAHRAMQELSFDTFRSTKAMEIEIPPSLVMALPHDYVGYTKVTWTDASGIEHTLYPAIITSNPKPYNQASNYYLEFDENGETTHASDSNTWFDFHGNSVNTGINSSATPTPNEENLYDIFDLQNGQRFGAEPKHMNANGSFYIDHLKGRVHFSGNCTGKTITFKYISDGVGYAQTGSDTGAPWATEINTEEDMIVHKFAQEAMIKHVVYGCLLAKGEPQQQGLLNLLKKEKAIETRRAKLRLSAIKLEEITQIMRGKSKWIKH